eukprot:260057-Prorocentrum_minimum.AAC.1
MPVSLMRLTWNASARSATGTTGSVLQYRRRSPAPMASTSAPAPPSTSPPSTPWAFASAASSLPRT